ncbi:MAG: cytochrome C biogenesis protein [Anaerolineaceae bacterium]|nr:cytochrome C biogenesis protein [Anaerolineaceae bacterium]
MKKNINIRINTFLHAILFVLGFSIVFIVGWGGAATVIGQVFGNYKSILGRIGGIVVILLGLFTLKIIKIPWLNNEMRIHWNPGKGGTLLSSVMMGVFFAAGWTPCIGTTLGAILTLGLSQQTSLQAMILSSGYALGLGIPFLAISLGMGQAVRFISRFRHYVRWVEIVSGGMLIIIGLMMVFDRMTVIAIWALQNGYFIDLPLGSTATPTYIIAVAAGLLSFLSPCVLPLVPAYVGYLSGKAVKTT